MSKHPAAEAAFGRLVDIMRRLRGPDGCPWDREQDLRSLRRYVLEEAYEVVQVIDDEDMEALQSELMELPEVISPFSAATLIEVLAHHVRSHGDRPHVLLWRSEDDEQTISYAELDRESCTAAAGLIERGLAPGDRVAIMLPTEAAFFEAFF